MSEPLVAGENGLRDHLFWAVDCKQCLKVLVCKNVNNVLADAQQLFSDPKAKCR